MPTPDPHYDWLSTREAAGREGVSPSTILRMIETGELVAEKVERPGGTRLLVRYERPTATPPDASHSESPSTPEPRQDTSGAIQSAVTPIAEALTAERTERQRLAVENAALRERVGAAEAVATIHQQAADAARELAAEVARQRDELVARLAQAEAERDAERAKSWWARLLGR